MIESTGKPRGEASASRCESDRAARALHDARAISRIASGDERAIAEIYDRYAPVAMGLALRVLGSRSEAEDVVHDTFLAVVERVDQYRPERGSVASWILTTARNLAIDRVRGRTRQAQILDESVRHEPFEAPLDPEIDRSVAEEARVVRAALARLSSAQRATLEQAFFHGRSYPEIAALHGVPLGTVKSRATRALNTLREVLHTLQEPKPTKPTRRPSRRPTAA